MTTPVFVNRPIRQPDRRGTRDALRLIGFTAVLAAPVLGYVALASVHQVAAEYRVSKLVTQLQDLEKRRDRLELTRASLLSLPAVEKAAREQLAMVPEEPAEPRADQPLEAVKPKSPPAVKPAVSPVAPAARGRRR